MRLLGLEPKIEEKVAISLIPHYQPNLEDHWHDYLTLDLMFRQALCPPIAENDIPVLKGQIERGRRANLLAYSDASIAGFRRMSFCGDTFSLGAIYVHPSFRNAACETNAESWASSDGCPMLWQLMTKAGYIIGKRAGYSTIKTVTHNDDGKITKKWAARRISKWDQEAAQSQSPEGFINFLVSTKS